MYTMTQYRIDECLRAIEGPMSTKSIMISKLTIRAEDLESEVLLSDAATPATSDTKGMMNFIVGM